MVLRAGLSGEKMIKSIIVGHLIFDCKRFSAILSFVDSNESITGFKHVVTQRDNDELSVFRAFLKIIG